VTPQTTPGAAARLRAWYRDAGWLGTVEQARLAARRRLPRVAFDYVDGGAETEGTMRANRAAFEAVGFEPRMGATRGAPDLATTVLGTEVSMPLLLSPVGFTRLLHREGDIAGARAADAAGTLFTLSSMSGHLMEDVAAAVRRPQWFQLYFLGGRVGAERLVERAMAAGFSTLVVTLDTQIPGRRERDVRNGFEGVARPTSRNVVRFGPQFARKPRWLFDFARDRFRLEIVNARRLGEGGGSMPVDEALIGMVAFPPTWDDVAWLCRQWPGPVIAKGVVGGDDARRAVDCGVAAIIVSNHGGRQLDGMSATLPAMVEVLAAVDDQVEVLVDGGVRRGSDVARAVGLGARAVMVGRAWAYALAAGGQEGVGRILEMFRIDLDRTMRLLGCPSVAALDRSYLRLPAEWGAKEDG
jgi:isopentenyl diphosphate isomerase/L-lactate dehydrogenase-like FMN-dependent dehydrogenase